MSPDKKELSRGLKFLFVTLPLFALAPILLNIGFSAIKHEHNYLWLIIGIIVSIVAIVMGFVGLRIISNGLFKKIDDDI